MGDGRRDLDLVLHGATGFTGRLVAEYLLRRLAGSAEAPRWALSGRSREKLERTRDELARATGVAEASALPLRVADAADDEALARLASSARVVCTTVGPYARYGSKLVEACARSGTDYCDLTGELPWMRRMLDAHQKTAEGSGARIVHSCGFDSIPSDLGVLLLQQEMERRHGVHATHVKLRVKEIRGGMSGGTAASMLQVLEEAQEDPALRRLLEEPYALDPEGPHPGADGADPSAPAWDEDFGAWTAPFVMGVINTRIVRRSHALLGCRWGQSFRYDEAVLTGTGPLGFARAAALSAGLGTLRAVGGVRAIRGLLRRLLPEPGEGPSAEVRERGGFDLRLVGVGASPAGARLRLRITGDRDPGYGSTAKMLGASALCLAQDPRATGGGFWTPASALGDALRVRLEAHAGLAFTLEA